ncbi:AsmA-like C-terminal region-containing protein [Planktotalea sp.]|uniref:YhdP family protein n=1 Tax=Planktotalea sp. TaxID=2029877 RepID=UPI0035C7C02F
MSDAPQTPEDAHNPDVRVKHPWGWYATRAILTGLSGFAVALAIGFLLLVGRDIEAPDWLQAQIDRKIAEALPGVDVGIGTMSLRVERSDLSPRVFFQNVSVQDDTGLPFASLGELSVGASFPAALRGQFLPKKISLSGALMKLRRDRDGGFDLTIGSALQASGEGGSLIELVERLDQLLVQPELRYLRDVNATNLTVLYEDARAGRAWTVDGGRMRVSAKSDVLSIGADFALLGGQDYATTLELSYESEIGSPAARIGVALADAPSEDIASQSGALAWMEALRAPISGSLRTEVDDAGALGPLNATLQIGAGVVQPENEAKPVPFDGAQAYFAFDPNENTLEFSEVSVKSAWLEARGEGRARLQNAPEGWPEALLGQFRLTSVRANPNQLYETPVTLEQADLDMRIVFDPFRLDIGQLVLREGDQTLIANGRADIGDEGWRVALDARADTLDITRVLDVWPDSVKPKTHDWIEQNILKGDIYNARLAFRALPDTPPDVHLDFAYEDASLRFMKSMPAITEARGYVRLEGSRFLAATEAGYVTPPEGGRINVSGTVFEIPDVTLRGAPATVELVTNSSITAALSLLDQDPFSFLSKAGQAVDLAEGRADLRGDIGFALKQKIPASEINFDIAGDITQVRSDRLVKGRIIAADKLALRAKTDEITLTGAGRIDAVPVEGGWRMPLGKPGAGSQLNGQVELSAQFVETFNIGLPPGSISGKGRGDVTLDLGANSPARFALSSNLRGMNVAIAPLGYRKSADARGSLNVRGLLGSEKTGPPVVESLAFDAPGLTANGSITISSSGTLERAQFGRVQVGDWLDSPVTLTGRGRNVPPVVSLNGGFLDLRRIPAQDSAASAGATPLTVSLSRLQVTKEIELQNFEGQFQSNGGLNGTFNARLNGKGRITGRTTPREGRTAVQITSSNAGATLSDAGLLKRAEEGALTLSLFPRATAGHYDGTLNIKNLRLRDAPPALALLSAASGIGLLEQLDGRGLVFTDVNSTFRITPKTIVVSEGSAIGPSLGFSVDGYYDVASKQLDMQGVVSPFFVINGIGSIFTRRGEGLIGFNFNALGPASAPKFDVNPLSLFTPGMFREIFRRPPPKLSQ